LRKLNKTKLKYIILARLPIIFKVRHFPDIAARMNVTGDIVNAPPFPKRGAPL